MARKKKSKIEVATPEVVKTENGLSSYKQDVTRSYSRKLNLKDYGGNQFETADFFGSRTAREVPPEEVAAISQALYDMVVNDVETSVKKFTDLLTERVSEANVKPEKEEKKPRITKQEMVGIKDIVQDLLNAKTKDDVLSVGEKIKAKSESLTESQIKYLREIYKDLLQKYI